MYYVIETSYVGPNQNVDRYVDADTIEIRTDAALTNSSHEKCTDGWCGTTNDWAVYAYGEYATIEEARTAIAEQFGDVRDSDLSGEFAPEDPDVVELYKPGKYAPMSRDAASMWAYESIENDIDAHTTDERIDELAVEYEATANSEGFTLRHADIAGEMRKRRQEMRDDLEAK